jgi:hypothetical protein
MVHELAEYFAKRVREEAGADRGKQVEEVYWIALGRPPTEEEMRVGVAALSGLAAEWARGGKAGAAEGDLKALTTYCHAMLNSAAFLYVD